MLIERVMNEPAAIERDASVVGEDTGQGAPGLAADRDQASLEAGAVQPRGHKEEFKAVVNARLRTAPIKMADIPSTREPQPKEWAGKKRA
jgi:hypothetical protein